jgi:formylglycine-generating enzyme required for sulfatase activity
VTWYDAFVYALWLGGRVPTVSQWEVAAVGLEKRRYPWGGDPPDCSRANLVGCGRKLSAVKVGREAGRSPDGVYDLIGNVSEWCEDWSGRVKSIKGQSYIDPPPSDLTNTPTKLADTSSPYTGFRVVFK